jgi:hypothetical protein
VRLPRCRVRDAFKRASGYGTDELSHRTFCQAIMIVAADASMKLMQVKAQVLLGLQASGTLMRDRLAGGSRGRAEAWQQAAPQAGLAVGE